MIERDFDLALIAGLALREKQIQQNYRPLIAVHKWFARRPGTLFRGLILSEFGRGPLSETFFKANDFSGKRICDPFMGGGTPLMEANRVGCNVVGFDINPMSWWIVREELEDLDVAAYRKAGARLRSDLEREIGNLYQTTCVIDGDPNALVKYFLWVKVAECKACGKKVDLFQGYLLSEDERHPRNVVVCWKCGTLNEQENLKRLGSCNECGAGLKLDGPVRRGKCSCPHCGDTFDVPGKRTSPYPHRLFAIEYHNPNCKTRHLGRFFKKPDKADLARLDLAVASRKKLKTRFIPDEKIPPGDETDRLHRWGYMRYSALFNARQQLGLELSCRLIEAQTDARIKQALATNLSDLLRYQNLLCRYDTMALKSLDVFSVHGFPVGFVTCESNILGIMHSRTNASVGSGGWSNIIEKYAKAKEYCDAPFEIDHRSGRKTVVPVVGEKLGILGKGSKGQRREIDLSCADSAGVPLGKGTLDAVFTDPPYFGNVQYAELMDFCFVWLRRLAGKDTASFLGASTRNENELTVNSQMGRGLDHFAEGLSRVFRKMAEALKPGAPLVFTYHHNSIEAYLPLVVGILDAGLVCSASIPCPAEMSASIHISGTGSSIIDTVLVCRGGAIVKEADLDASPEGLVEALLADGKKLAQAGVTLRVGDFRCMLFGLVTRLATWYLSADWEKEVSVLARLGSARKWISKLGNLDALAFKVHKRHLNAGSEARAPESTKVGATVAEG
ncbi:MAG: DUF1156 domain-containing protein [Planctomycetes bacterium]|nr:DUF1156 domain-containing protein [Planctomycetota bacterium]